MTTEQLGLWDVQNDLKVWHTRKYYKATLADIGLKLGEEAGEVMRALDRLHYAKNSTDEQTWRENLTDEIGDAAIVLMVLCNRGGLNFEDVVRLRAAEVMER